MYYLGIDLGGTNIKAGICDAEGKIILKDSCPTDTDRGGDGILEDMGRLALSTIQKAGLTVADIEYAGIASPGTADPEKGVIVYASTLPFLNYPIAKKLTSLTGIEKIYIANDANAAAKGEAAVGAARGCRHSLMITLGTGVGGGIIIDGQVYCGFNYAGAELGHIVIEQGGKSCTCGRKGCWEMYASATALIEATQEKMKKEPSTKMWEHAGSLENVDGRTAFDMMKQGDLAAKEVVDEYISYLASGIISMINIFQPEVLSIGGGISGEKEHLLRPLMDIVNREQYSRNGDKKTDIRIAQLGNDAGIIGAAMLGL